MKNHGKRPIDNPRRCGKHVAATIDFLELIGATGIEVTATKHLCVAFSYHGHDLHIRLANTPNNEGLHIRVARGKVRGAIRQAGLQVP